MTVYRQRLIAIATLLTMMASACEANGPTAATQPAAHAYHATTSPLHGIFVTTDEEFAIVGIEVPTGASRVIRPAPVVTPQGRDTPWAIGGPDAGGTIAFIEARTKSYALKVIRIDGSGEKAIFTRDGDPLWKHAAGTHIALSNHGNNVALVAQMRGVQMPGAYIEEGPLEVCDVSSGKSTTHDSVLDVGVAWLADDHNLVCVRLVPRSQIPASAPADDGFGEFWSKWDRVPAICILDIKTGTDRVLCEGVSPVVSINSRVLLVVDFASKAGVHWRRVDIDTGKFTSLPRLPIESQRLYAAFDDTNASLYFQMPGPDEKSGLTKYYSPLRGPQPLLLLKAGKFAVGQAEMIGNDFDGRAPYSFGKGITFPVAQTDPTTKEAQ